MFALSIIPVVRWPDVNIFVCLLLAFHFKSLSKQTHLVKGVAAVFVCLFAVVSLCVCLFGQLWPQRILQSSAAGGA